MCSCADVHSIYYAQPHSIVNRLIESEVRCEAEY